MTLIESDYTYESFPVGCNTILIKYRTKHRAGSMRARIWPKAIRAVVSPMAKE